MNGLEVNARGGLGGIPRSGYFWVQLEPAGGAALKPLLSALRAHEIPASVARKKNAD